MLRENQPRILYLVKLSFKSGGEILSQTKKKKKKKREFADNRLHWKKGSRDSLEGRKIIQIRNSNLHKESKH